MNSQYRWQNFWDGLLETTTDERQALEQFAPGNYDVIMIDLGMSGISGDRLMRQIKDIDPQVATVLITGWVLPDTDTRVSSFDFHVVKPFDDLDAVEEVVARAIALSPCGCRRSRNRQILDARWPSRLFQTPFAFSPP